MTHPSTTATPSSIQARVLGLAMLLGPANIDAVLAARLAERLAAPPLRSRGLRHAA